MTEMTASELTARYEEAARAHGPMMGRLAASFERDAARAEDLVQQMHVELWRSLAGFAGQCSLKSWTYRIAHNVAVSHVMRETRREDRHWQSLDEVEIGAEDGIEERLDGDARRARLLALVHRLKPTDRQIILLHLEDMTPADVADLLGLTANNVSVRLNRAKALLARLYHGDDQ